MVKRNYLPLKTTVKVSTQTQLPLHLVITHPQYRFVDLFAGFGGFTVILILILEADFSTPTKNVITLIMTE